MKNIARFAMRLCVFAALLSQAGKECASQAFSVYDTLMPQEEGSLPQIYLSEIQGIFIPDDAILPQESIILSQVEAPSQQDEETELKDNTTLSQEEEEAQDGIDLSQESSSRKSPDKGQKDCDKIIAIRNVEVFVDNIRDEHIESQIQEMAGADISALIANPKQEARELEADIVVRQRSYYKKTRKCNSIYVYYSICDKNGERLAEDWHIAEGRDSIISAAVLSRQIKKAVRGMKRHILNYNAKSNKDGKK